MTSNKPAENAWKYCGRAVQYGLMTSDTSERQHVFTVVSNWRELADAPERPKLQPAPRRYEAHPLQSIWGRA